MDTEEKSCFSETSTSKDESPNEKCIAELGNETHATVTTNKFSKLTVPDEQSELIENKPGCSITSSPNPETLSEHETSATQRETTEATKMLGKPLPNSSHEVPIQMLENWCPVFQWPNHLRFRGKLETSKNGKRRKEQLFLTSPVKERVMSDVVRCQNGSVYRLVNAMYDPENHVPLEIKQMLSTGIPTEWNVILLKWIEINCQQQIVSENHDSQTDDNLPLRRSSRGRNLFTPLRYWMNERIVSKKGTIYYRHACPAICKGKLQSKNISERKNNKRIQHRKIGKGSRKVARKTKKPSHNPKVQKIDG